MGSSKISLGRSIAPDSFPSLFKTGRLDTLFPLTRCLGLTLLHRVDFTDNSLTFLVQRFEGLFLRTIYLDICILMSRDNTFKKDRILLGINHHEAQSLGCNPTCAHMSWHVRPTKCS